MLPMPPADLRYRVAGSHDADQFDASGRRSAADFAKGLAAAGRSLSEFHRILEWGCGCGRILRHLPVDPERQEVHGSDIDGEAIAWLQANIPQFHTVQNGGLPPLPYPDAHFDLIINHSVLSHLDERYQDAWLAELRRVLSPDGVLVLTVHGRFAYEAWRSAAPAHDYPSARAIAQSQRDLARRGIYFLDTGGWASHFPAYYQNTFHTAEYVFRHWSAYFDIVAYLPRGSLGHQDMVVMRHRQAQAPIPPAPGAGARAALLLKWGWLQAKIAIKSLITGRKLR